MTAALIVPSYYGRTSFRRTIKILCLQSEAIRFGNVEKPVARKLSRAEISYSKTCQYPVTTPTKVELRAGAETWKCNATTQANSSYCPCHHAICYVPVKKSVDN